MVIQTETYLPKLRAIDVRPFARNGRPHFLLRDPLHLIDKAVTIPQQMGPLLVLCDGTRDASGLCAAFAVRFGLRIGLETMEQLLIALDEALLLDNDRFALAHAQAVNEYRGAPYRSPGLAGQSYPADTVELDRFLQGHLDEANSIPHGLKSVRGLISPHIDYMRGAPVYAKVWKSAEAEVKAADLVVLLGTDHMGGEGSLTLTRQHYATPFGILPTAREIVDELADALGEEAAFGDELHHRSEHSIELAAVWLHHVREKQPCQVIPILCGSFGHFVRGDAGVGPDGDPEIDALVSVLRQAADGRSVLVVAAADLSHVGPAFGGQPLDFSGRARLQAADDELIEKMCAGDAKGFFETIKRDKDRHNVCGLSPIYLLLRTLSPTQGYQVAYDRCVADQDGTSVVSICGILYE